MKKKDPIRTEAACPTCGTKIRKKIASGAWRITFPSPGRQTRQAVKNAFRRGPNRFDFYCKACKKHFRPSGPLPVL